MWGSSGVAAGLRKDEISQKGWLSYNTGKYTQTGNCGNSDGCLDYCLFIIVFGGSKETEA